MHPIRDANFQQEIGDSKQAKNYPQLKVMKWNNRANISVRFDESPVNSSFYKDKYGKTWFKKDKLACCFYPIQNGYEFETILYSKPDKLYLPFTIESKQCLPFYQPSLSNTEKADGSIRPPDIEGSYALYTPLRFNGFLGNFKVGHIKRAWIEDSKGNKDWCDWELTAGLLKCKMPSALIKLGNYPIRIDPTFGYESAGSSTNWCRNRIWASIATMGATGGTGDSMDAYISASHNSQNIAMKGGLYDDSTGAPNNFVTNGATDEYSKNTAAAEWHTFNFSTSPSLSASTAYWLCMWGEKVSDPVYPYIHYDSNVWDTAYDNETYDGSFPASFTSDGTDANTQLSIHINYTESGGGGGYIDQTPIILRSVTC